MPVGRGIAGGLSIQPGHMSPLDVLSGFEVGELHMVFDTALPGTASNTLEIPIAAGTQNYFIDWGDDTIENFTTGGVKTHVYAASGTKSVRITGTCFGINYGVAFDNTNDRQKLINIDHWGSDITWVTLNGAFTNCTNLNITAVDAPDWTAVTDASFAFTGCVNITTVRSNLPTGNIDNFLSTWSGTGITTFPPLNFSNAVSMISTWQACTSLVNFPSIAIPNVTTLELAFFDCTALLSWGAPIGATPVLTSLLNTYGNAALASYPLWDTSTILTVSGAWQLNDFSDFPALNLSNCTNFEVAWLSCNFLGLNGELFPVIDFSSGTNFKETWRDTLSIKFTYVPDLRAMTDGTDCFLDSFLSCPVYSGLLENLAVDNPNNTVTFHAGINTKYDDAAQSAHDTLTATKSWTLIDGGVASDFISTWDTTNAGSPSDTIEIPIVADLAEPVYVDWGDGTTEILQFAASFTHVYTVSGIYEISICGEINNFAFRNTGDKSKLIAVSDWDGLDINEGGTFFGCDNLALVPTDSPNFNNTMDDFFNGCVILDPNTSAYNTTGIDNFSNTFKGMLVANPDVSNFDMSAAIIIEGMFQDTQVAAPDTSLWNTSALIITSNAFKDALAANPDVSSWVTNLFEDISGMFFGALAAKPDIQNWSIANIIIADDFLTETLFAVEDYEPTLINWVAQAPSIQSNVTISFGIFASYHSGAPEDAKNELINTFNWTIFDGGLITFTADSTIITADTTLLTADVT